MAEDKCSFKKHGAPVFGNRITGTMFDAFIRRTDGRYRMDVSWRTRQSLAVAFSDDGMHWSEPVVTLGPNPDSGWEQIVNRNCVVASPDGKGWLMWYTGQVWENSRGRSWIGIARSDDGIHFERFRNEPVLIPEKDFEKESVMGPFVMVEDGKYRMWYTAGETYEPDVICYAESYDGIKWIKYGGNPIFCRNPERSYEQDRIGACDILREKDGYLMFYIGYRDVNTACICAARSENGITDWSRVPENPLVTPSPGTWDEHSCYKPTVVKEDNGYRIWYNGRRNSEEYIGCAFGTLCGM